jgi:hypothetical protein
MHKRIFYLTVSFFFLLCLPVLVLADESFTITTYYPSPYGSYNELTTYSNTYLATTSGNVGIGTTGPGAKLEVSGGDVRVSTQGNVFELYNGAIFNSRIGVASGANTLMTGTAQGDLVIQNYLNNKIFFGTNGDSIKMTIQGNGNVGIGTTNPAYPLEVRAPSTNSTVAVFTVPSSTNGDYADIAVGPNSVYGGSIRGYRAAGGTGDIGITTQFSGNFVERVRVTSGGNVGIGTTSPGAKLEVAGDAKITGGLKPDYDSGWFAVNSTAVNTYTLTHNLGGFPTRVMAYTASSNTPTWVRMTNFISAGVAYTGPEAWWMSTTEAKVTWCCSDYVTYCDVNNPCPTGEVSSTSGYMKVLMWK